MDARARTPQRVATVLLVLVGLGIWAGAVEVWTSSYRLEHQGISRTVSVTRLRGSGKDIEGLVNLPLPGGGSAGEWLGVGDDGHLGAQIEVLYLPDDPGSVTTRDSDQMAQWYPLVLLLPLGGMALWAARRAWRSDPDRWQRKELRRWLIGERAK